MFDSKTCCLLPFKDSYFYTIRNSMIKYLEYIAPKEMFGDDAVFIDYNNVNDMMYMKSILCKS